MMANFYFTEQAEKDLEAIIDFTVQRWGAAQSHNYIDDLEALAQILADNALLGTERDELSQGLRSFPYQSHLLFYVLQKDGISIVRVLHTSVDVMRYF
jgi:toxin ParE1/3/4